MNNNNSKVINVTDINILSQNYYPRVINYTASWCRPCHQISPEIDKLSIAFPNIYFFKVDINKHSEYCEHITSIPFFEFYLNKNTLVNTVKGAQLEKIIDNVKKLTN